MNRDDKEFNRNFSRLIEVAYLRDGGTFHTGEALLLACLLHAKGSSRESQEMRDLRKIMRDINLETE